MRSRTLLVLLAAAVCGAGGGIGLAIVHGGAGASPSTVHAQAAWGPGQKLAPSFQLRDERGIPVSLRSQRGRVVIVTFLDSRCHAECPIEGHALAQLGRRLGRSADAELLVVSVDPWGDSPASARRFATESRWMLKWHWLLGRPAQLRPVWSSYAVAVKRTKADILHTVALYVIDRHGYQRAAYLFPFAPAEVASDIRTIAAS